MAGVELQQGLYDRSPFRIGFTDHGGFGDGRMRQQAFFYFSRSDAETRRLDQVVRAPLVPKVPLLIPHRDIVGAQEGPEVHFGGFLRVLIVAQKARRGRIRGDDFTLFTVGHVPAVGIDQPDIVAGVGTAHRPRLTRKQGRAVADKVVYLGHTVEFVAHRAQAPLHPLQGLCRQRLAPGADDAQAEIVVLVRVGRLGQSLDGRRGKKDVGYPMARHECVSLLRPEPRQRGCHGASSHPRRKQHVEQPTDPRPVGGGIVDRVFVFHREVEEQVDRRRVGRKNPVRVQNALGFAGRPRGVHQQRGVIAPGVVGPEVRGRGCSKTLDEVMFCPDRVTTDDVAQVRKLIGLAIAEGRPSAPRGQNDRKLAVIHGVPESIRAVQLGEGYGHPADLAHRHMCDPGIG